MQKILLILLFTLYINANDNFIKPDSYTKEGYCIVSNPEQRYLGLNRFKTAKQFKRYCNSKMIFKYNTNYCKIFTMEQMKFDIYISDGKKKYKFKVGEKIKICSKEIIESLN